MAREFSRTQRVAQQVHKEVASIIQNEFKHRAPDVGMITLSEVEVARDLAHAKIYVTFYENDAEKVKSDLALLQEAKGFIRTILAKRIRMRNVPALHFFNDSSLNEGIRISQLVSQARAQDDEKANRGSDEEE